jgi:hypothetical protein
LKGFDWQTDKPKSTLAALNALIRESARLPLNVYILKFTLITNILVSKGLLSPVNRVVKLLEGLDDKMRVKVIELCTTNGWRVMDQDTGEAPNFDEIKKFLEHEALMMERISVYERQNHCFRPTSNRDDSVSAISHTPTVMSPKLPPTPRLRIRFL